LEAIAAETKHYTHVEIYTMTKGTAVDPNANGHKWVHIKTRCGWVILDPWFTGYPEMMMIMSGNDPKPEWHSDPNQIIRITPEGEVRGGNPYNHPFK
jgi:hypothetical protein